MQRSESNANRSGIHLVRMRCYTLVKDILTAIVESSINDVTCKEIVEEYNTGAPVKILETVQA